MQAPIVATFKHSHEPETSEPIRCAPVFKPTPAQRHKNDLVRYLVLAVAFVAVVLLIAIALYYTRGNSVHIQHLSFLGVEQPGFHAGISSC